MDTSHVQSSNPQEQSSNPQGQSSNPPGETSNPQGQSSNPQGHIRPRYQKFKNRQEKKAWKAQKRLKNAQKILELQKNLEVSEPHHTDSDSENDESVLAANRERWMGVILELKITIAKPEHDDYDPTRTWLDSRTETETYKIRVPVWKLPPKVWANIDVTGMKYTGKFDDKLYDEIVKIDFIPYKNVLYKALKDNTSGVEYRKLGCGLRYGSCCSDFGFIRIDHMFTW
jgi:hypothetical protein